MCKSCASCVRILMIVFNTIFTFLGLFLLGAALYLYFSTFGPMGMTEPNLLGFAYIVTAIIGGLSFVLGILGCCGSYHYSRCLLGVYFILLLIIFAIEIAIGVAVFVNKTLVREIIDETIKVAVEERVNSKYEIRWIDGIQIMFQCCGYNGPTDYDLITYPDSCCPTGKCSPSVVASFYMTGCKDRVIGIAEKFIVASISVIVIALVELIGLVFAMILCCAVNGRDSLPTYYPGMTAS